MDGDQSNNPEASAENPYAPPLTDSPGGVPDAPASFGWQLDDRSVWVKKNSQLPMVDPFTGGVAETMMLQRVEVRFRPHWLWVFPMAGGLLAMAIKGGGDPTNVAAVTLTGIFLGWLLSLFVGLFFPFCTLHVFITKRTYRIRKTFGWVMNGLFLLFLPGSFVFALGPSWLRAVPFVALILWLIGTVASLLVNRRLRCRHRKAELFEIRGFHRDAIAALAVETAR